MSTNKPIWDLEPSFLAISITPACLQNWVNVQDKKSMRGCENSGDKIPDVNSGNKTQDPWFPKTNGILDHFCYGIF